MADIRELQQAYDLETDPVGVLSLGDIAERVHDEEAAKDAFEGISHPAGKERNI